MKSKLFQRLAALPGINWFNRKEKMEYSGNEKDLPRLSPNDDLIILRYKADKYFFHILVLKKYIEKMHGMVGQFDNWIATLDEHYFKLEKENETIITDLKQQIENRDNQVAALEKKLKTKSPISHHDIVLLLEKMDELKDSDAYKTRMKNKRNFGRMHNYFHNFLQKMGENYNGENLSK